jgi:hypothetical protein
LILHSPRRLKQCIRLPAIAIDNNQRLSFAAHFADSDLGFGEGHFSMNAAFG